MTTPTTERATSVLLTQPGAVSGDGVDAGVAAHYGSFNTEQRSLEAGEGFVDLSHRDVFTISGPDRLKFLHTLTSQFFEGLAPDQWISAALLSPNGHVEHFFSGVDNGETFTAWTEPGRVGALVTFLERMKFWSEVTITVTPEISLIWLPTGAGEAGRYEFIATADLAAQVDKHGKPAGFWAFEALRIARGESRFGADTDEKSIPNELGWLPGGPIEAVHLEKGCYRGQETIARVHNLGRPPRRLTLLHLDGTENRLPAVGAEITVAGVEGGRAIGFVGASARHHELGPIALAMIKRNVDLSAALIVDGIPASQEVIVDPEVGLHFRPMR